MLRTLHPDELALLAGVCHEPTDPTARGVYADWVQEHVPDSAFGVPEKDRPGLAGRVADTLRADPGDDFAAEANAGRLYGQTLDERLVLSDPGPADYAVRSEARSFFRTPFRKITVDMAGTLAGRWRGLPCLLVLESIGQLCAADLTGLWRLAPIVAVVWPAARFTGRLGYNFERWQWGVPAHDVPRSSVDKYRWLAEGECEAPAPFHESIARRFLGRRCVDVSRQRCGLPPLFPGRRAWEREAHDVVLDKIEQHAYRVPDGRGHGVRLWSRDAAPWYDLGARGPSILDPRFIIGPGGV